MNIFLESHQQLLKLLNQYDVKFLLVGGYAVIYHGYKRTTGDMDLWLEPSNENKDKIISVLSVMEFDEYDIEHIKKIDFTKHFVFHFWEEPERVDCLTQISNVAFNEAFEKREIAEIDGILVPVIQYSDLIISKMSSERLKDKADVEELQKIKQSKSKPL